MLPRQCVNECHTAPNQIEARVEGTRPDDPSNQI